MRSTLTFGVLSLLAAAAGDDVVDCAAMKGKELRKWLVARGLECKGCSEKQDFVDLCNANKDAPLKQAAASDGHSGNIRTPGSDKAADIDELLKSMKGVPGMENLKMFTADDLKNMGPEAMASAFSGDSKRSPPKKSRAQWREELVDFYTTYGLTDKLDGVDAALDKFKGREAKMMDKVYEKYKDVIDAHWDSAAGKDAKDEV